MSKRTGTAYGQISPTQFVDVLSEVGKSVATILPEFKFGELICCLRLNGKLLSQFLHLVFTALLTGQGLQLVRREALDASRRFRTFHAGQIGIYHTIDAVKMAFERKGYTFSDRATEVIDRSQLEFSSDVEYMEWIEATGSELGFETPYAIADLLERAEREFNLKRCQPEDAFYIRLGSPCQPLGEMCHVAMEPVTSTDGWANLFCIANVDGERRLSARIANPKIKWSPHIIWVFRRSKPFATMA